MSNSKIKMWDNSYKRNVSDLTLEECKNEVEIVFMFYKDISQMTLFVIVRLSDLKDRIDLLEDSGEDKQVKSFEDDLQDEFADIEKEIIKRHSIANMFRMRYKYLNEKGGFKGKSDQNKYKGSIIIKKT